MKIFKKKQEKETPTTRKCETCPRWEMVCKVVYDEMGHLPEKEYCPIWNGSFDPEKQVWSHQKSNEAVCETDDIEDKLLSFINKINENCSVRSNYVKVDDDKTIVNVTFIEHERIEEILYIHIDKRKIDYFIHDDEYLFKLLKKHDLINSFTLLYQFIKHKFKKMQLRGTSNNRIHMELFDLNKLDEYLYSFVETYYKVLFIIDFKLLNESNNRFNEIFGGDK